MSRRSVLSGVLLVTGLGLLTACGSSERPKDVSMDEAKPCELISGSDRSALEVTAKPTTAPNLTAGEEGEGCVYLPRGGDRVDVDKVTNYGIDRWLDDPPSHAKSENVPGIEGFRTIKVWRDYDETGPHDGCTLYVDVASGQSLKVQVAENSENDPPTCDTAREFAAAAMKKLTQ